MSNKRPTLLLNITFSIIIIFLIIIGIIVRINDYVVPSLISMFSAMICLFIWLLIYSKIKNKLFREAPVIESPAVLSEKIQEDHRSISDYFLSFELDDGSLKTFPVVRDVYAKHSKNKKGILKYKQVGTHSKLVSFD